MGPSLGVHSSLVNIGPVDESKQGCPVEPLLSTLHLHPEFAPYLVLSVLGLDVEHPVDGVDHASLLAARFGKGASSQGCRFGRFLSQGMHHRDEGLGERKPAWFLDLAWITDIQVVRILRAPQRGTHPSALVLSHHHRRAPPRPYEITTLIQGRPHDDLDGAAATGPTQRLVLPHDEVWSSGLQFDGAAHFLRAGRRASCRQPLRV